MERESFVFYRSFARAISRLPDSERLKAYDTLVDYALYGNEPDEDGIYMIVFDMARDQIDANNRRYANGKNGGRPKENQDETKPKPNQNQTETKPKPNQNQTETKPKPNVNVNVNVNDNVLKDKKESVSYETPKKKFLPPTKEEVQEYCRVQELTVEADTFVDFYASKDWMVGKNKMKDWKAAVRNWSRSNRDVPKQNKFHNFTQRETDLDDLEARLDRQFAEMEETG